MRLALSRIHRRFACSQWLGSRLHFLKITQSRFLFIASLFLLGAQANAGTITVSESTSTDGTYRVSWSGINTALGTPKLFESGTSIGNIGASGHRDFTKTSNGTFSYKIEEYACMMGGCSVMGTVGPKNVTVSLGPNVPSGIYVPANDTDGIVPVYWNSASGASSYKLEKQKNNGGWSQIYSGSLRSSSNPFNAPGLSNGSYKFRVKACSGSTCSAWKTSTSVNVLIPPSHPSSISTSVINAGAGTYKISWLSVSGAQSYPLEKQVNNGSWTSVSNTSATSKTLTLADGSYRFRVKACHSSCSTSYRTGSTFSVLKIPGVPTGITYNVINASAGLYYINWNAASGSVSSYKLERKVGNGSWAQIQNSSNRYKNENLADGTYQYRVRACNATGCNGYKTSNSFTVVRTPNTPSSINISATNAGAGQYKVDWSASAGTVTSYRLERKVGSGSWSQIHNSTTRYKNETLSDGSYQYRVRACNSVGCSPYKTSSSISVLKVPGVPNTIVHVATGSGNGQYRIDWAAASGSVTSYKLERKVGSGSWSQIQSSTNRYKNESLTDNSYQYRVRACNATGCGGYRTGGVFAVTIIPSMPSITVPPTDGDGTFPVTWTASTGSVHTYKLERQINGGSWTQIHSGSHTVRSKPQSSLPNATYRYRVKACSASNVCSSWRISNNLVVANSNPATLTISESQSTDGSYRVSWSGINTTLGSPKLFESGEDLGSIAASGHLDITKTENGTFSYTIKEYSCVTGGCSVINTIGPESIIVLVDDVVPVSSNIDLLPVNAAGALAYSASVSGHGDASVSIPLELIPGVNGFEPILGINYNSNRYREIIEDAKPTEDSIGSGWRFTGLSQIRMCNKHIPGENMNGWNEFALTNLCLDGEPLLLVPPADEIEGYEINEFDLDGVQYVLWNNSDVRVVRYQTLSGAKYNVYYPNGSVAEFGYTEDSNMAWKTGPQFVTSQYAINKLTDAFGNTINYTYHELFSEKLFLPKQITYGNNQDVVIEFGYELSHDEDPVDPYTPIPGGHYGDNINQVLRPAPVPMVVNQLRMSLDGVLVREYRLRSESINGTWSRLAAIQKCAYDNSGLSTCIEPLQINWQAGYDKYKTRVSAIDNGMGSRSEYTYTDMTEFGNEANFSERPFGEASLPEYTEPVESQSESDLLQTVVTQLRQSDGVGGMRTGSYAYQGRGVRSESGYNWGFLGFYAQRIKDESTGIYRYTQHSLNQRLSGRVSASISTLGKFGDSGSQVLSKTINRYELASVYHGKHEQNNGITMPVKPMLSNNAYLAEQLSLNYEAGELISASLKQNEPDYVAGTDGIFRSWEAVGERDPRPTLEYPLQSIITSMRQLNPAQLVIPSSSDWGFYNNISYGQVLRSSKTITFLNESRLISDYYVGFANRVESYIYDGDIDSVLEQSTVTTASPYVTAQGKTTLKQSTKTEFNGDVNLENTTSTTYSSSGIATGYEVHDSNGVLLAKESVSHFADGRFPQTVTNALGHSSDLVYDIAFGSILETTDPNNLTSNQRLDSLGRVYETETSDGVIVSQSVHSCENVSCPTITYGGVSVTPKMVATESSQVSPESKVYVDALGRTIRKEYEGFDGTSVFEDVHYNSIGQKIASSLPYYSGETPVYTLYEYDSLGRAKLISYPDGSSTTTAYAVSNGKLIVTTTNNVVDSLGLPVESKVKRIEYNKLGEIEKSIDAYGNAEYQVGTEFEYYASGLTKRIKVNGKWAADFIYDAAGNRTRLNDQSIGSESNVYNSLGQLIKMTDSEGNVTEFEYDLLGRPKSETTGDGVQSWFYDPSNAKGALDYISFVDNRSGYSHKQTLNYTSDSKLDTTVTEIKVPAFGLRSYTQGFTYDSFGRPKTSSYPSGITVTNTYNSFGYLERVADGHGNDLQVVTSADSFGNVTQSEYGNGIASAKSFNPYNGALESITSAKGGAQIQNSEYEWRSDGFLESRTNHIGGLKEERFTYDSLGRMRSSSSSSAGNSRLMETAYSINGNILSRTASNDASGEEVPVTNYQYGTTTNAGPNAVSKVKIDGVYHTLHYNRNGAITHYDAATGADKFVDWNARGKPWRITKGVSASDLSPDARDEIAYGVDGFRYYKKSTWVSEGQPHTEHTFYIGSYEDVIPANDPDYSRVERSYINDHVMQIRTTTHLGAVEESLEFLHKDQLGSIQAITDINGNILQSLSFDAFGARRNNDWMGELTDEDTEYLLKQVGIGTSRGYTGHEHLDRTGLIHMNGRVFDPKLARFLSPDPLVQAPYFSQSYNRYSYTFNNPLSFTDPSGYGAGAVVIHGATEGGFCNCYTIAYSGALVSSVVSAVGGNMIMGGAVYNFSPSMGYAEDANGNLVRVPVGSDGFVPDNLTDGTGRLREANWTYVNSAGEFDGNVADGGSVVADDGGGIWSVGIGSGAGGHCAGNRGCDKESFPINTTLEGIGYGSLISGAGATLKRYSLVSSDGKWKAKNGSWYNIKNGPQPNGYTGSRIKTVARAQKFAALGARIGVTGMAISSVQLGIALNNQNYWEAAGYAGDIIAGGVMTFGGPIGFIAGASYFGIRIAADNL